MIKQKEIVTLLINRLNENDCGIYAIQPVVKSGTFLATLNLESIKTNFTRKNLQINYSHTVFEYSFKLKRKRKIQ